MGTNDDIYKTFDRSDPGMPTGNWIRRPIARLHWTVNLAGNVNPALVYTEPVNGN